MIAGAGRAEAIVQWIYIALVFSLIVIKSANKSNGEKPVMAISVV